MSRADSLGIFWQDVAPVKLPNKEKIKRVKPARTWEDEKHLPNLEEALAFNMPQFNDVQLREAQQAGEVLVLDEECYINYFLIAFKSIQSGRVIYFEFEEDGYFEDPDKLLWIMNNFTTVSFNGLGYDMPLLAIALTGQYSTRDLKIASDLIIQENVRSYKLLKQFGVQALVCNHIDIKEPAPLNGSLKVYGGRIHTRKMQDLPYPPEWYLGWAHIACVRLYCINDLDNTIDLYNAITKEMALRYELTAQYGVDVRSKSDAQIAEAILGKELKKLSSAPIRKPFIQPGTVYRYNVPQFLRYQSGLMQWVLDKVANTFFVVSESGNIGMPKELSDLKIEIGNSVYKMGIGGLHSTEKTIAHYSDDEYELLDHDVESYYPRIILNQCLYPKHLGPAFLRAYSKIVNTRLTAKHRGDKAVSNSLKIVINGSFGKLGSMYSILYAPDLLIQVTITGQLSLLMLIERMELGNIPVVSANTDGIVVKCKKTDKPKMYDIIKQWECDTAFKTDETCYKALYSRDVNNYIAIKTNGEIKSKGAYARPGLSKNPTNEVCIDALEAYLTDGTPIAATIESCTNLSKFVNVRKVKGGAIYAKIITEESPLTPEQRIEILKANGWVQHYSSWVRQEWIDKKQPYDKMAISTEDALKRGIVEYGEYLGKVVRWYYSRNERNISELVYAGSGNKVPRSDGARPMMQWPDKFPNDIDYDWYINETESILKSIGAITNDHADDSDTN